MTAGPGRQADRPAARPRAVARHRADDAAAADRSAARRRQRQVIVADQRPARLDDRRLAIERVGRRRLRLDAERVLGLRVDHPVGAVGLDRQLEEARPAQERRPAQVGEAVVPWTGRRRDALGRWRCPSASRTYIAPASSSSSTSPATPSSRRRNQGCQPIEAGIGSSAWTSRRHVSASADSSKRWTAPAGERPVRAEVRRDRAVADDPPATVEHGPMDGVRRQGRPAARDRRPSKVNAAVADPAGVRRHRERAPLDRRRRPSVRSSSCPSIRSDAIAATGARSMTTSTPGAVEVAGVRASASSGRRIAGHPHRHRPAAGRGDGRERLALGDQLVDRRRRPEDLLVEPDDDPADRLPERRFFFLVAFLVSSATAEA